MHPDLEVLLVAHLRDTAVVTALTTRIGTRTPPDHADAWVKVTLLDEQQTPGSPALHLVDGLLQVDCYAGADRAGGHAEASLLARTVREALHGLPAGSHDQAVVTAARVSMTRQPDADFDPARERYVLTVNLAVHPTDGAS